MGYGLKQSEMQCWEKRKSEIYPELLQCGGRLDHRQSLVFKPNRCFVRTIGVTTWWHP